jgi:hypothetical protein
VTDEERARKLLDDLGGWTDDRGHFFSDAEIVEALIAEVRAEVYEEAADLLRPDYPDAVRVLLRRVEGLHR